MPSTTPPVRAGQRPRRPPSRGAVIALAVPLVQVAALVLLLVPPGAQAQHPGSGHRLARSVGAEHTGPEHSGPEHSGPVSGRPGPAARLRWPLAPPHPVLRRFEAPDDPYGPGHRGVDLGGHPDQPVWAAADGVVVYAGQVAGRPVVSIRHAGGLRTTYEPVQPSITAGREVRSGQRIGLLLAGHPECAAVACLHWGARQGAGYVDPLTLLAAPRVRLLPWRSDG